MTRRTPLFHDIQKLIIDHKVLPGGRFFVPDSVST